MCADRPFVTSAGPYADPSQSIFRSVDKEKWVARQDFVTALNPEKMRQRITEESGIFSNPEL